MNLKDMDRTETPDYDKPYLPVFYSFRNTPITEPIKKIKGLFRDIKCFIHRGRYGWCFYDWFSFDSWFYHVAPQLLEDLNQHRISWSPVWYDDIGEQREVESSEEWGDLIDGLVDSLRLLQDDNVGMRNPYAEEYEKALFAKYEKQENGENGNEIPDELKKNYIEGQKKIELRKNSLRCYVFNALKFNIGNLWD